MAGIPSSFGVGHLPISLASLYHFRTQYRLHDSDERREHTQGGQGRIGRGRQAESEAPCPDCQHNKGGDGRSSRTDPDTDLVAKRPRFHSHPAKARSKSNHLDQESQCHGQNTRPPEVQRASGDQRSKGVFDQANRGADRQERNGEADDGSAAHQTRNRPENKDGRRGRREQGHPHEYQGQDSSQGVNHPTIAHR